MSDLVNKILREAEDSSDDFFQSKHIQKRKSEIRKRVLDNVITELEAINMYKFDNEEINSGKEEIFMLLSDTYASSIKSNNIITVFRKADNKKVIKINIDKRTVYVSKELLLFPIITYYDTKRSKMIFAYSDARRIIENVLALYFKLYDFLINFISFDSNNDSKRIRTEVKNISQPDESSRDITLKNNNMYNSQKIYDDFYKDENTNKKAHDVWWSPEDI